MSISRHLLTAIMAGMVIFAVAVSEAKGPKGPKGNQGKKPSFSTGASKGQGIQGGGWTTPPGWKQGKRKGWDTSGEFPPGFDNVIKQRWHTKSMPPGLQKKQ